MNEQQLSKWLVELSGKSLRLTIVASVIESVSITGRLLRIATKEDLIKPIFDTREEALAAYRRVQEAMGRVQ